MRLDKHQIETIREAASEAFGEGTVVTLFGSRTDDDKRGGDIDLLISPAQRDNIVSRKIRMLMMLERNLGERRIDIVIELPGDARPIVEVAHRTGIAL